MAERDIEGGVAGAASAEGATNGEEGVAEDIGVDEQALVCVPLSLLDILAVVLLKRWHVVPGRSWARIPA